VDIPNHCLRMAKEGRTDQIAKQPEPMKAMQPENSLFCQKLEMKRSNLFEEFATLPWRTTAKSVDPSPVSQPFLTVKLSCVYHAAQFTLSLALVLTTVSLYTFLMNPNTSPFPCDQSGVSSIILSSKLLIWSHNCALSLFVAAIMMDLLCYICYLILPSMKLALDL